MSETPLKCWVIIETTGEISCAHCNCMAGLGEVCTHVAAVLLYLEALQRIEEVQTCTQLQCGWIVPSASTTAQYLKVKNIDFSSARGKKKKLDEMLEGYENNSDVTVSKSGTPPTDAEME